MADRVGFPSTLGNLNVRFSRESNSSNKPKNIQTVNRLSVSTKEMERYKTRRKKAKGTRRMANVE
jgi:hypothetical protein